MIVQPIRSGFLNIGMKNIKIIVYPPPLKSMEKTFVAGLITFAARKCMISCIKKGNIIVGDDIKKFFNSHIEEVKRDGYVRSGVSVGGYPLYLCEKGARFSYDYFSISNDVFIAINWIQSNKKVDEFYLDLIKSIKILENV